jgi:hypothetical protein
MIYPSWWGEDTDFDNEIQKDKQGGTNKGNRSGKITKKNEDSLDKRLRDVEERKK